MNITYWGSLAITGSGQKLANSFEEILFILENCLLLNSPPLIVLGSEHNLLCPPAPLLRGQKEHRPWSQLYCNTVGFWFWFLITMTKQEVKVIHTRVITTATFLYFIVNYIIKNAIKYFTFFTHKMGIITEACTSYRVVMQIRLVNTCKMLTMVLPHGEYYMFVE